MSHHRRPQVHQQNSIFKPKQHIIHDPRFPGKHNDTMIKYRPEGLVVDGEAVVDVVEGAFVVAVVGALDGVTMGTDGRAFWGNPATNSSI